MFQFTDYNIKFNTKTLENGTKLVVFEKPNAPVAISILFYSGSKFDPAGKEGTAHFLEHMLTSGTARFPTKDKIATYIEEVGGVNGASVNNEVFEIYTDIGDAEDIGRCFEILEEELFHSLFDEATLEKERKAIMNELDEREASPGFNFYRANAQLIFQETEFYKPTLQSSKTVENISKQDLLDYKKKMICSNRMTIIISGGVTMEKMEELVKKHLYLEKGDPMEVLSAPFVRKTWEKVEPFAPLKEQVEFALSFRVDIPFLHPDSYALRVLDSILGDGRSSILTKKLRYERGLVYSVGTGHNGYLNAGAFYISGSTNKKDLVESLDVINDTLTDIKRDLLTADQVDFAKNRVLKSAKRRMQSTRSWVNTQGYASLASLANFGGDMEKNIAKESTLEDYFAEISAVKMEDLDRVLKAYLTPENWYLCLMGNDLGETKYRGKWFN